MKTTVGYLVMSALLLQTSFSSASETAPVTAPGTGVTMVLPSSMQRGPIGTYFMEPSGHTFIQIAVGRKENAADNAPLFRKIYPMDPKIIEHGRARARLYKRTRSDDGGAWDGWSYNLVEQGSALNVSVMYTGSDSEWFDSFERVLETLQWDERQVDSEASFQAHISIPGLQLVQRQVGQLSFTANGSPGSAVPSFAVQAMPVTPAQAGELFPAICETALPQAFGQGKYSGPHQFQGEGVVGCDGWGAAEGGKMLYVALVQTVDGAMLSSIGNLAPTDFDAAGKSLRSALLQMKR